MACVLGCSGKTLSGTYELAAPGSKLKISIVLDESGHFKEITKVSAKSAIGTTVTGRYKIIDNNLILVYPEETTGDVNSEERERKLEIQNDGKTLQVPNNSKMKFEKTG